MQRAAIAAEPMAKPRQNARLCHNPARLADRWCRRADCRFDARPGLRRGRDGFNLVGEATQALFPERDLAREIGILVEPLRKLAPILGIEHAEHVFGGRDLAVVLGSVLMVDIAHRSRQVLNFISPRLIQLFIVPSGTFMRSASCS